MADLALNYDNAVLGTPQHGDLVLGPSGDLQLTAGTFAIEQAVCQAVKQFTQDWYLNMDAGLPYREQLFGGKDLSSSFVAVMQNRVLQVPGVLGLLSWSSSLNRRTRALAVSFTAQCTGGVVNWSINLDMA